MTKRHPWFAFILSILVRLLVLLVCIPWAAAQEATPTAEPTHTPTPFPALEVTLEATDGQTLYGEYFATSEAEGRAVLLLHQLYSTHASWTPLIYPLLDAGYKVLAVDLRGYGKTRGAIDWGVAQEDTIVWADWLKAQPGVTSIALVGSSMGSSLALVGCAAIDECVGAVAISPGLSYYKVYTGDAVQAGFPSLIVYADQDTYPKRDVPKLQELGGDSITTITYVGREHGVALFATHDDLIPQIIAWIGER